MRLEAFLPKCRLSRPGRQRRRPDCLFAARFVSEPPREPKLRGVTRPPPHGPRRPAPHACALALALALEARKGEWGGGPAWPKCRRCLGRSSRRSQSLWDSRSERFRRDTRFPGHAESFHRPRLLCYSWPSSSVTQGGRNRPRTCGLCRLGELGKKIPVPPSDVMTFSP